MSKYIVLSLSIHGCVAVFLVAMAVMLPNKKDIRDTFSSAATVTEGTRKQVDEIRAELDLVRRDARLQEVAERLSDSTRAISSIVTDTRIDFATLATIRDATGQVADGLDNASLLVDPQSLSSLAATFRRSADFLDQGVIPTASQAADRIEKSSHDLKTSAQQVARLAQTIPLDIQMVRELEVSLGRFDGALKASSDMINPEYMTVLKDAVDSVAIIINDVGDVVETLAKKTLPNPSFEGIKPKIEYTPIWSDGAQVTQNIRNMSANVKRVGSGIESIGKELPELQHGISSSRETISAIRQSLKLALEQQDDIQNILEEMPKQGARIAEELPGMLENVAHAIRNTQSLEQIASVLRESGKEIDNALVRLPEVQEGIAGTATLLRVSGKQMDLVLQNREGYETAMNQTQELAKELAASVPAWTAGIDSRLERQADALDDIRLGLEGFEQIIPKYERSAEHILAVIRNGLWVVSALVAVHGMFVARQGLWLPPSA